MTMMDQIDKESPERFAWWKEKTYDYCFSSYLKFNYDNSYDDYDDSYPSALHGEEEKHINIALPSDDDNYDNSNDDDDNSHPSALHGE